MDSKNKKKHSIKSSYTFIFTALLTITIVSCWLANMLFLGSFYVSKKTNILKQTYSTLDRMIEYYGYDSTEFGRVFENNAFRHNLNIIIFDSDMNVIKSNSINDSGMSDALLEYLFGDSGRSSTLYQEDRYSIERAKDEKVQTEYIQLFGIIADGDLIVIRTPISSIRDSAEISNIFLMYIGILAIAISCVVALVISKNISQPILKLVDISERMAKLDFNAKYEGNDNNEIGLLGERMNYMSETLENTISELKSANIELKKDLEKRNEIDEMRKEFLSNVSHELKTPIALIQGYAEGLTDCVNDDEESKIFYCEVIIDETQKMNKLVKNLLQLNELEFGQNNVHLERIDIVELIKNCVSSVDILFKQNNIKFIFNYNEPIYVWTDEFKIEMVINNYISNAIHYCSGDEKVIEISINEDGDRVRVNVFNTGAPIPDEAVEMIWTKFYKVDKARTREYGGNGVGLSIVEAAMKSLNQKYGVTNYENGVTFWFEADAKNI